jgi:hypothetical protein
MTKADDTVWLEFVESKVFSKQIGELPAEVLTSIQSDLVQHPQRGDIVKGTHGVRKREWLTRVHHGERAEAFVICICTLNMPAEFTCSSYSAKRTKATCHLSKRASSAH